MPDAEHELTVVIPTYNESANLVPLFERLALLQATWRVPLRVLVMDDGSPDGTARSAAEQARRTRIPTEVVVRSAPRSMGVAIVEGLRRCPTDLVCVMDADLSHPPSLLPLMVERLNGFDGVVASRFARDGRIVGWPLHRRLISRGARALARLVARTPSTDPVSGFFLFRRASLDGIRLTGLGHKPLVEILARAELTLYEVPYHFHNRENGASKLSVRAMFEYLELAILLLAERRRERRIPRSSGDAATSPHRP